MEMIKEEEQQK